MTTIDSSKLDELEAGPDLDVIAKNIVAAKKRLKKSTPAAVDFATAVSGLSISDTMVGSSTLTVTIDDAEFALLDSGFFDSDKDGRIDPIDLRYPEGSRLWWRLTQCNPRSSGTIEMVFMERAAVHMMAHRGPLKVSRAKRTRAQFLKMLTLSVKVAPITFVSKDLNVVQTGAAAGGAVSGKVISAGDSLAVGTEGPLHDLRPSVTTRATTGFTSSQVLSDLQGAGSLPKTLVISAGTNDTNVSTFRNNVRDVLDLPGVDQVFWVDISRPDLGGTSDSELNAVLREEAAGHSGQLHIIGWQYAVDKHRVTLTDDIHPNAEGYKYRARLIDNALGKPAAVAVPARSSKEEKRANKGAGINQDEPLKIGSHTMTAGEINNAERALDVADKLEASEKAALALAEACIVEAPNFANPAGGDASSVGILQLLSSHLGGSTSTHGGRRDIELVCKMFLKDGFTGKGGAIALASAHPDWSAGQVAQACQGSAFPARYDEVEDDAKAVIEAYGGGGGFTGTTFNKQYNFEVGTPDKKHENFWDAANRLAGEVKWPFFIDGQHAYFDPETTLIRQKPVAVIQRDDPSVISWDCTYDGRHIATELRIDLICEPFEFRAGEVLKMVGFGPASTGSTVGLPGRWLISEIDRQRSSMFSSFTLKQPEAPEPEPKGEKGTRADTASDTDLKNICDEISRDNRAYELGGGHGEKLSAIGAHDSLDCSSSCSLALYRAKMFDGDVAIVSGQFASSWGKPGRGEEFTVWANGGHVFMQSESGDEEWRFDTGGGPPSGPHVRASHRSTAGFTPRHWEGS